MENKSVQSVTYDDCYLEESWKWFQDEELRRLTMTPAFSKQEQMEWFSSLSLKEDYLIFGIEFDGQPVGAFGIKNITEDSGEYWGYIGAKRFWGRGIGKWMVYQTIEYAKNLGLRRLWLKVLDENTRAINLYLGCGFEFRESKDEATQMEIEL